LCLPAAELGDYEDGYHTPAVVSEFHFIPHQTEEMEIAVLEEYKKCRYVRPVCLASCHSVWRTLHADHHHPFRFSIFELVACVRGD
jgi:hypothetical protein